MFSANKEKKELARQAVVQRLTRKFPPYHENQEPQATEQCKLKLEPQSVQKDEEDDKNSFSDDAISIDDEDDSSSVQSFNIQNKDTKQKIQIQDFEDDFINDIQQDEIQFSFKKKCFEQYYQDEPYEPQITGFDNPSGRPTNIPEDIVKNTQVKPRKPWIYIGSDLETNAVKIDEEYFSQIFKKAKEEKRPRLLKKDAPKNKKKKDEQISQVSEGQSSNLNSLQLNDNSELPSELKSRSKQEQSDESNSIDMSELSEYSWRERDDLFLDQSENELERAEQRQKNRKRPGRKRKYEKSEPKEEKKIEGQENKQKKKRGPKKRVKEDEQSVVFESSTISHNARKIAQKLRQKRN